MRAARWLAIAYGVLCAGALLLVPISAMGWFGVERDPLSAIFAYLLGLPWSLVLGRLVSPPAWLGLLLIAIGMGVNAALILWLGRAVARRRAG